MKKALFLLALVSGVLLANSQMDILKEDSWKVYWNKKLLLSAAGESEAKNSVTIAKTGLQKKYCLEIRYKEADAETAKAWKRSFLVMDESDNELMRVEKGSNLTIRAAELKKCFKGHSQLKIYTIAIPKDPELAARVRVKRVHVVTLSLE